MFRDKTERHIIQLNYPIRGRQIDVIYKQSHLKPSSFSRLSTDVIHSFLRFIVARSAVLNSSSEKSLKSFCSILILVNVYNCTAFRHWRRYAPVANIANSGFGKKCMRAYSRLAPKFDIVGATRLLPTSPIRASARSVCEHTLALLRNFAHKDTTIFWIVQYINKKLCIFVQSFFV